MNQTTINKPKKNQLTNELDLPEHWEPATSGRRRGERGPKSSDNVDDCNDGDDKDGFHDIYDVWVRSEFCTVALLYSQKVCSLISYILISHCIFEVWETPVIIHNHHHLIISCDSVIVIMIIKTLYPTLVWRFEKLKRDFCELLLTLVLLRMMREHAPPAEILTKSVSS